MAATQSAHDLLQMLWKEAMCTICLDYLSDPVSIGCGHSFCRVCLILVCESEEDSNEWEDEDEDLSSDSEPPSSKPSPRLFSCPQCRKTFTCRNFHPNWQLGNMVQIICQMFQASHPVTWENEEEIHTEHQLASEHIFQAHNALSCVVCQVWNHKGGVYGKDDVEEKQ